MKKLNFLTLLIVVLIIAACSPKVNNDETSGNNNKAEPSIKTSNEDKESVVDEKPHEENKENKSAEDQASEEPNQANEVNKNNVNTDINTKQVEFSGQIDQTSIEVITSEGTPLALRIENFGENVDFGALNAGDRAEVEYYTNEHGQNMLTNFVITE
ncbi:hypothetical protein CVD25_18950 [Bacillus canaveralius]|uniref:DUF3221 domain-containing protein n=1 Tax=Bacillus canaveralius TaxID=1403243 RepID=A0A2N5GI66_9BACI|nr:hypothetical protein [Bacillus canaveralius]PLR80632.1 hypothetical protein CU635_17670 [Bacillus canaveralius]PLR91952.1 hypothetical protein CVD25_18950 [Bacillus canaveralius]RSK54156.1 hypothetical protein EJA13_06160 [Bacillus canaveralius]